MSTKLYTNTLGEGPDLVLLHGWAIHSGIWAPLLPMLTQHFRVTLVDLPGFGLSAPLPGDYHLPEVTQRIIEAVPSPAIWLGWSLGGLVTLSAAIQYPNALTQAVLVTSSPKFIAAADWPGLSLASLQQFVHNLNQDYHTTLTRFITSQLLQSEHSQELKALVKAAWHGKPPSLTGLLQGFKMIREADLRPELAKITCPALYIFGRSDALVPVAVSEQISQWHPTAEIAVIRRAGHAPFLSHPETFLELVTTHCCRE